MTLSQREGGGALHRLGPGGRCHCFAQGWTIPNGPAITPDGTKLYWADSHRRCVFTLDIGADGRPGEPDPFLCLPEAEKGVPDGMALDAEGCLWVALNGGGRIRRFGPDGRPLSDVLFSTPAVSSCTFGGEGLSTLFVTTARHGAGAARETDASGALFAVQTRVRGIPAREFPLRGLGLPGGENQEGRS
jgi:sugar lactone lactonase YvrE